MIFTMISANFTCPAFYVGVASIYTNVTISPELPALAGSMVSSCGKAAVFPYCFHSFLPGTSAGFHVLFNVFSMPCWGKTWLKLIHVPVCQQI
jgi:hypothetical protein